MAFTVGLLSNQGPPSWTADEWAQMAAHRRAARAKGKEPPLPAALDALIQLEAADQLEAAGRHDEAVTFAAYAVEESPGHEDLIAWESRLLAGDHDPHFSVHDFLFGRSVQPDPPGDEKPQDHETGGEEQSQSQL